jgi:hypothetical protein
MAGIQSILHNLALKELDAMETTDGPKLPQTSARAEE